MLESSKTGLEDNRKPKGVALLVGETPTVSMEKRRKGRTREVV